MTSLDMDEIVGTRKKKQDYWENKFNIILEKCHKKIKVASKKIKTDVLFEVPLIEWGVPKYDVSKCIRYIVQQLIRNGFTVTMANPRTIRISWEKHVPKDNTRSLSELIEPPQKLYIQHKKDLAEIRAIALKNELQERNAQEYFYVNNNDIPQTRIQPLYVRPNYPQEKQAKPTINKITDRPLPTRTQVPLPSIQQPIQQHPTTPIQAPKVKEKKKKYNFTFN